MARGICDNCGDACKIYRCTRCQNATYCSRPCQRKHWKEIHRLKCSVPDCDSTSRKLDSETADPSIPNEDSILSELAETISKMSLHEARTELAKAEEGLKYYRKEAERRTAQQRNAAKDFQRDRLLKARKKNDRAFDDNALTGNEKFLKRELYESLEDTGTVYTCVGWSYTFEYLHNIFCYMITLIQLKQSAFNGEDTACHIDCKKMPKKENLNLVCCSKTRFAAENVTWITLSDRTCCSLTEQILLNFLLPGIISRNDVTMTVNETSIYLRISNAAPLKEFDTFLSPTTISSPKHVNCLLCRYCNNSLLQSDDASVQNLDPLSFKALPHENNDYSVSEESGTIKKVLPLPSGYWDEVSDLITCTEIDKFHFDNPSLTATKGCAFENGNVLVLHKEDLGSNVCVLSIPGYGATYIERYIDKVVDTEAAKNAFSGKMSKNDDGQNDLFKKGSNHNGIRQWRDIIDGATVCCSRCCSTLGITVENAENSDNDDVNSIGIYKHRVSVGDDYKFCRKSNLFCRGVFDVNTCGSFFAREMIKYAENQGVYTFVVYNDDVQSKACMLLKLLSWNTKMATVVNKLGGALTCGKQLLKFWDVLKIIFEEFKSHLGIAKVIPDEDSEDLLGWNWGGMDSCCPPYPIKMQQAHNDKGESNSKGAQVPRKPVCIYLANDEYLELRKLLVDGCFFFTKYVSKMTCKTKLGRDYKSDGNACLSYLSYID